MRYTDTLLGQSKTPLNLPYSCAVLLASTCPTFRPVPGCLPQTTGRTKLSRSVTDIFLAFFKVLLLLYLSLLILKLKIHQKLKTLETVYRVGKGQINMAQHCREQAGCQKAELASSYRKRMWSSAARAQSASGQQLLCSWRGLALSSLHSQAGSC